MKKGEPNKHEGLRLALSHRCDCCLEVDRERPGRLTEHHGVAVEETQLGEHADAVVVEPLGEPGARGDVECERVVPTVAQDRYVHVAVVDLAGTRDAVRGLFDHLARVEAELLGEGEREGAAVGSRVEAGEAAEVPVGPAILINSLRNSYD